MSKTFEIFRELSAFMRNDKRLPGNAAAIFLKAHSGRFSPHLVVGQQLANDVNCVFFDESLLTQLTVVRPEKNQQQLNQIHALAYWSNKMVQYGPILDQMFITKPVDALKLDTLVL